MEVIIIIIVLFHYVLFIVLCSLCVVLFFVIGHLAIEPSPSYVGLLWVFISQIDIISFGYNTTRI